MKKVLIAVSQLRVGGVSKALIELLKNINDKYEVTLLCFDHNGAFYEDIPTNINIIGDNPYLVLTERSTSDLKQYGDKYRKIRQICSAWTKCFNKTVPAKFICWKFGKLEEQYDVAIAFGHPQQEKMFCNLAGEVVLNCVNAKKKVIVIHCDYEKYGGHCKCNDTLLMKFDRIAAVSKSVGDAVVRCIPQAKNKICTLRNFHDFYLIHDMAVDNAKEYGCKHSLVTVARLSEEKGLEQGVKTLSTLKTAGYDLEWHIVGEGSQRTKIEKSIQENNAGNYIFLEGEQKNPYRYIKNADYLFVPSLHEAAPMVFDEAASLGVPIISTDTLSAYELVAERKIGYVGSIEKLTSLVKKALSNQVETKKIMEKYCANNDEARADFECLCND